MKLAVEIMLIVLKKGWLEMVSEYTGSFSPFRTGFPGAQPVSMDEQNIKLLEQKPYKVSWKADGTR